MARTPAVSDEAILERLRKAGKPLTAASVGVSAARLHKVAGVKEAGAEQTGKRGRPSLLFTA